MALPWTHPEASASQTLLLVALPWTHPEASASQTLMLVALPWTHPEASASQTLLLVALPWIHPEASASQTLLLVALPWTHPEASASQTPLLVALPWTNPVYHKREKTGPHHRHHRNLPGHHCQKYRNVIVLALKDNSKWENYHLHQSHICKPLSSERAVAVLYP